MKPVRIYVFNSRQVSLWEEELKKIPENMQAEEEIIQSMQNKLIGLKHQNGFLSAGITKVTKKIGEIREEFIRSKNKRSFSFQLENSFEIREEKATYYVLDPTTLNSLSVVQKRLESKEKFINADITIADQIFQEAKKRYEDLVNRDNQLNSLIAQARKFIENLQNNPKDLVDNLTAKIIEEFDQYRQTNYSPSLKIRLGINRYRNKIDLFKNETREYGLNVRRSTDAFFISQDFSLSNNEWRLRYAECCGFLWSLFKKVYKQNYTEDDRNFIQLLYRLLKEIHLGENNDLPDELSTGKTCKQHFRLLTKKYPGIFLIKEHELLAAEKDDYEKVYNHLEEITNLASLRKLKRDGLRIDLEESANRLLKSVNRHIHQQCQGSFLSTPHKEPEFALYAKLLHLVKDIFDYKPRYNVHEKDLLTRLEKISNVVSGSPSFKQVLLGGVLIFFGLAVVALSISFAVSTFFAGTPLSALGIFVGFSLVAKAIGITTSGCALGPVAASVGFVASGMRRDISQQVSNFVTVNHRAER